MNHWSKITVLLRNACNSNMYPLIRLGMPKKCQPCRPWQFCNKQTNNKVSYKVDNGNNFDCKLCKSFRVFIAKICFITLGTVFVSR